MRKRFTILDTWGWGLRWVVFDTARGDDLDNLSCAVAAFERRSDARRWARLLNEGAEK